MQPARRLHPPSRPAWFPQQRRLSRRLASGMTPAHVARAEGVAEAELQALLAEPDFAALVQAYRELEALDAATRLARLEQLAMSVLEDAMCRDDVRVALFILGQCRAGLNPARTVAERVVKACEAARTPPRPAPKLAKPRRPRPYDAVAAALRRGAARACLLVAIEHEQRAASRPVTEPAPVPPPPPARPAAQAQPAPAASPTRPAPRGGWPNGP